MDNLIVLVADKNTEAVINTLFSQRINSLNIKPIAHKIFIHPHRDSGLLNESHEFLRQFNNQYQYAMVIFDKEGCGKSESRRNIENTIETNLSNNGWQSRCVAIVIEPELEIWMWSSSPHVAKALGWEQLELAGFLEQKLVPLLNSGKPERPKEAIESALREKRIPRSSSIYSEITSKVSLDRCSDSSFLKFRQTLQQWFPNVE
jgi:hypothetical protein